MLCVFCIRGGGGGDSLSEKKVSHGSVDFVFYSESKASVGRFPLNNFALHQVLEAVYVCVCWEKGGGTPIRQGAPVFSGFVQVMKTWKSHGILK